MGSTYHLSLSNFPLHHTLEEKLMPSTALYMQIFLVYLPTWIILNATQNSYRPVDQVPQSKNPHQEQHLAEDLKWSIAISQAPCELLWDLV